jgi:hypothetical protein
LLVMRYNVQNIVRPTITQPKKIVTLATHYQVDLTPDKHTHYQVDLILCTCRHVYLIVSGWPKREREREKERERETCNPYSPP